MGGREKWQAGESHNIRASRLVWVKHMSSVGALTEEFAGRRERGEAGEGADGAAKNERR